MLIGITERGDAALDLSWIAKLPDYDGAILITKNVASPDFLKAIVPFKHKVIIHATITGYGGTRIEPNVPPWQETVKALNELTDQGYNTVLRVDPIIPTIDGTDLVCKVIEAAKTERVRMSFIDLYPHVLERLAAASLTLMWSSFHAPAHLRFDCISELLHTFLEKRFEMCAENAKDMDSFDASLCAMGSSVEYIGCVSKRDLDLLGLKDDDTERKGQRPLCGCLACKTEMLENKGPCRHGCVYCYWKNNKEMKK